MSFTSVEPSNQAGVAVKINAARADPAHSLVEFETDATPTGQKIYVDASLVAAIENPKTLERRSRLRSLGTAATGRERRLRARLGQRCRPRTVSTGCLTRRPDGWSS